MICGIDEAGRGPLAGPVCAAAVILPKDFPRNILKDSKKLTPRQREGAMKIIYREAFAWGIGWASAFEIDHINILKASLLAMKRAFEELAAASAVRGPALPPGLSAIVDGLYVPDIPLPCRALVKADAQVPEVMAASILAKTARDRMMERYSWLYPDYGYDRHKGYPTQDHLKRIALYGPSPIQRRSFRVKPLQLSLFNPPAEEDRPQDG
ncbi:MAG: ribonuclease HII [Spirochaetaceae bacterium]|jgi:ribonuclease HII|nr:ribonuclease HII [Spirochaetaceae bacterium]